MLVVGFFLCLWCFYLVRELRRGVGWVEKDEVNSGYTELRGTFGHAMEVACRPVGPGYVELRTQSPTEFHLSMHLPKSASYNGRQSCEPHFHFEGVNILISIKMKG